MTTWTHQSRRSGLPVRVISRKDHLVRYEVSYSQFPSVMPEGEFAAEFAPYAPTAPVLELVAPPPDWVRERRKPGAVS